MFAIVIKSSIDLHSGFIDCHWKYFRTELLTGTTEIGLVSKDSPAPLTLGWCGRFGEEILLIASLMRRAQPAQWSCSAQLAA